MLQAISLALAILNAPQEATLKNQDEKFLKPYDLLNVKWQIAFDEGLGQIFGEVENRVLATEDAPSLDFHAQQLRIQWVKVNGANADFRSFNQTLRISPISGFSKDQTYRVEIKYSSQPELGVLFVSAKHAWPNKSSYVYTQGQSIDTRRWLPTYDLSDDKATSEGTITAPKGYYVLSNGRLVSEQQTETKSVFKWKMEQKHSTYLISFAASQYEVGTQFYGNIPVQYVVPKGYLDWGKTTFGNTPKIIAEFERLTGVKYPYAKYAQAVVPDFTAGGMENITATIQHQDCLHNKEEAPYAEWEGLVAHELAHMWFGDWVTCKNWSHVWTQEGFATFMEAIWARKDKGETAFDYKRIQHFRSGISAHIQNPKRALVADVPEDPNDLFDDFAYAGGASRLYMLMHEIGEKNFWAGTNLLLKTYGQKTIDTDEFIAVYEKASKRDLQTWKKQWCYTNAAPDLTVSQDGSKILVKQAGHTFNLEIDLWAWQDGSWIKNRIKLDRPALRYEYRLDNDSPVLLDPEGWLMANIKYKVNLTQEQRLAWFRNAPMASKFRIAGEVFADMSDQNRLALYSEAIDPVLRQFLARFQKENAVPALIADLESGEPNVRTSAAQKLSEFDKDERTISVFQRLFNRAEPTVLRRLALSVLLKQPSAENWALRAYKTDSHQDSLRVTAFRWFERNKKDEARKLAIEALQLPASPYLQSAALSALGNLKDEPGSTKAYDLLIAEASGNSYSYRNTAINALGRYGNKAAIPLLKSLIDHATAGDSAARALKALGVK